MPEDFTPFMPYTLSPKNKQFEKITKVEKIKKEQIIKTFLSIKNSPYLS
jgi:hypothetical protein